MHPDVAPEGFSNIAMVTVHISNNKKSSICDWDNLSKNYMGETGDASARKFGKPRFYVEKGLDKTDSLLVCFY